MTSLRALRVLAVTAALVLTASCSGGDESPNAASERGRELVGLFRLTPGTVAGSQVRGTWFRMLQPGGTAASGPYMINADSPADGGRATLLRPGSSGGLRTGGYQSQPVPAFDAGGNSLAATVTAPTRFFGVRFSISTNGVDPQTRMAVPAPAVFVDGDTLSADLSSWAASWNRQNFNQGAPKPVSGTQAEAPGQQEARRVFDYVSRKYLAGAPRPTRTGANATGTYDAATRAFVLQWTSAIAGGPFNGFTGLWHLEGTFVPGSAGPAGR